MKDALGWKLNDDGNVVITMTATDWAGTLLLLGAGSSALHQNHVFAHLRNSLALLNRLNVGNPNYTPYQVDREEKHG